MREGSEDGEMGITDEIKYYKDFCPLYEAIEYYNHSHINQIFCTTEMCENICNTVDANEKESEDK